MHFYNVNIGVFLELNMLKFKQNMFPIWKKIYFVNHVYNKFTVCFKKNILALALAKL